MSYRTRSLRAVAVPTAITIAVCIPMAQVSLAQCDAVEFQKITVEGADRLGYSIDISSPYAIIGSPDVNDNTGAAFIYRFNGSIWTSVQELSPSIPADDSAFGHAVAIGVDRAIVGVPMDDLEAENTGAAEIFHLDDEEWVHEARLSNPEPDELDTFGMHVAIQGDVAVVGAPRDDDAGDGAGAVYVFRRIEDEWTFEQKLIPTDDAIGSFGGCLELQDNRLVIGAPVSDDPAFNAGTVYVFEHDGFSWNETARIAPSDVAEGMVFGSAVDAFADTIVIGAPGDATFGTESGACYIFRLDGDQWVEEQKLVAPDGSELDRFGTTVSIDDRVLVAGAHNHRRGSSYIGSTYLYHYNDSQWERPQRITASDGEDFDDFGLDVALEDDHLLIGAPHRVDPGAFYAFDLDCRFGLVGRGFCPGPFEIMVLNGTPESQVALLYAEGEGAVIVPPGMPCAGLQLGLDATTRLGVVRSTDADGRLSRLIRLPQGLCGRFVIQAVDLATCQASNTVWVDE